ncbi:hypothetical protein [Spiroplasma endosymbiont of Sarcophaga variegata]
MNETLMIALLVLAGAGGIGSLGILGLSAKKRNYVKWSATNLISQIIQ